MTDLTDSELEQLRRALAREVGKEKDTFMRSHLSNLAEVIETYLKADEGHRPTVRIYLTAALVRLENKRSERAGNDPQ